jgi:hypothetical protein
MENTKKEKIIIDKIQDYDGNDIYLVKLDNGDYTFKPNPPKGLDSGFFTDLSSLNDWIELNSDNLIITEDYRDNE